MAIATLDGLIAAASQRVSIIKTASMTTVATIPFSPFAQAGNPGAGVLAGTSTTTGVVPTDATAGIASINAFGGGNIGYINKVEFGSSIACRITLFDLLWKGGAYAFNASTTGQTPTSFSNRVLGGTDYTNTELWLEQVTAATGIQSVNVTYTNQAGTPSKSTGVVSQGTAGIVGRMTPLPLASGDTGVQGVTGVVGSVASVGTFNILVMRRLWQGRVRIANDGDTHDMLKTGLPQIFEDSAIYPVIYTDATASGIPEIVLEIVNG